MSRVDLSRRGFMLAGLTGIGAVTLMNSPFGESRAEYLLAHENTPAINPGQTINEKGDLVLSEWQIELLAQAGCKSLRMEMSRAGHQEGWSDDLIWKYKQLADAARGRGMEVSMIMDYGTVWGDSNNEHEDWNENSVEQGGTGRNDYMTKLVKAAALLTYKMGGSVQRIEVWNEPFHWGTKLDYSIMAGLLTDMSTEVLAVNPNMELVFGGDMVTDGTQDLLSYIDAGEKYFGWNGKLPFHSLGAHMYLKEGTLTNEGDIGYWLRSLRKALPVGMPIRLTEVGWTSDGTPEGEEIQAENLRILYSHIAKHPEYLIHETNWFSYMDILNGGVIEGWGLVDTNHRKKPAYYAFQKYAAGMNVVVPTATPSV